MHKGQPLAHFWHSPEVAKADQAVGNLFFADRSRRALLHSVQSLCLCAAVSTVMPWYSLRAGVYHWWMFVIFATEGTPLLRMNSM